MRHFIQQTLGILLVVALSVSLVGCDDSPTSVQDFDIQPDLKAPSNLNIVLIGGNNSTTFTTEYQGVDGIPVATAPGGLSIEETSSTGSPRNGGSTTFTASVSSPVTGIVRERVIVRAQADGREIVDSLTVTIAPFSVTSAFEADFATIEDYDARSFSAVGGASATLIASEDAGLTNTTGTSTMEVSDPGDGSSGVLFERRASVPNSDRFSVLIRPDASTDFDLTFTFTTETGSGTAEYQYTLPVAAGDTWQQFGIGFSQIGADFNPVDARAGGNGPLVSVELSASENVTYYVDELLFATANQVQAEVHDFEATSFAYSCITQSDASDVADESPGFTARRLEGGGCFGYNFNNFKVQLSTTDYLQFRVAGAAEGDQLYAFIESSDDSGGYNFDGGRDIDLPAGSDWQVVQVPLGDLGDDPSVLFDVAMRNVGFETKGDSPNILIDDIQFVKAAN